MFKAVSTTCWHSRWLSGCQQAAGLMPKELDEGSGRLTHYVRFQVPEFRITLLLFSAHYLSHRQRQTYENNWLYLFNSRGLHGGSDVKNLPAIQETQVWSLGWEDPLEKDWQPLHYSYLENPMDGGA